MYLFNDIKKSKPITFVLLLIIEKLQSMNAISQQHISNILLKNIY